MKGDQHGSTSAIPKLFQDSLANWGGWSKLIVGEPRALLESVSESIDTISQHFKESPTKVGSLPPEEWNPIAKVLPSFFTAYLQQELNRILHGPGDLITALRLVECSQAGRFLLALVIVAREHRMLVEGRHRSPYAEQRKDDNCDLSSGQWASTLTIKISQEHGEESIPLLLHYHGEELLWDKTENTPTEPVHVPVNVNQKLAVFFDGSDYGDATLQQHERDKFLKQQGFDIAGFSALQIEKDVFACAAESIKLVSGKVLPPSRT